MTPILLMETLAVRLQKLLTDYSAEQLSGSLPIKVYPCCFPIRSSSQEKHSSVYVFVSGGTSTEESSVAKVELGFSIYGDSQTEGWRNLYNIMEHVRQDLLRSRFIDMKYRLEFPLEFSVIDEPPFPQWQGKIVATYAIGHTVEEGFNFYDYQET